MSLFTEKIQKENLLRSTRICKQKKAENVSRAKSLYLFLIVFIVHGGKINKSGFWRKIYEAERDFHLHTVSCVYKENAIKCGHRKSID